MCRSAEDLNKLWQIFKNGKKIVNPYNIPNYSSEKFL